MSAGPTHSPPPPPRNGPGRALGEVLAILAVAAVLGLVGAVVWEWLWTPPTGVAYQHQWFVGSPDAFSATGLFTIIAAVIGLVLGVGAALVIDRDEVLTVVAVLAGAVLAAVVMMWVGHHLGPPDPDLVARTAKDRTRIPGDLSADGVGVWLVMPISALIGELLVLFAVIKR